MNIEQKLKEQIKENPILIYMKGTPYEPQCGFSAKTVQILIECESQFSYVDVLANNEVRVAYQKFQIGLLFLKYLLMESLLVELISFLKCMKMVN